MEHKERIRRYLPFKLYNELVLNPSPETSTQCAEHLGALLQTVQTYCSAPILGEAQPHPDNVWGKWCEATLLFADITGFTALSERLSARGRAGAEEITGIVNEYFTAMVEILHQHGGDLVKFGGDALLGIFAGSAQETARRAAQAALNMQRAMVRFAEVDTSVGRYSLQMTVGIHTGKVFAAHVGTASQMEYWVTGEDTNLTALAEEAASAGQVVVSAATRQHLDVGESPSPLPSGGVASLPFYSLPMTWQHAEPTARQVKAEAFVPQELTDLVLRLDTLTPYLPTGVLPRLVYDPHRRRVEGEHRLVAVLFVNVGGFGELASKLAAGQADVLIETMQDYYATMQSIVERHGGTINKTDLSSVGDKLLAIFGAPVSHEDDADQAARAALEMQAALEGVNQRLEKRHPQADVHLRQRVGLSTGFVFCGNVGSAVCQEYTIMGDEVNLAARLVSAAAWGEIWVSSHVFYWLEPFGTFEPLGTVSVKGKEEPVPTYRLQAMGETYRPQPAFVDRTRARSVLQGCLQQLTEDQTQGQIVLLTGEPGIGKSRLWAELRSSAEEQDIAWLVGHCHPLGVAHHLLGDILRRYLGLGETDDAETQRRALVQGIESLFGADPVEEKAPFLAIVMGLPLPDEWKDHVEFLGERLPDRLAQEVALFFARLADEKPLVLVCEDVHWLDEGSAGILTRVAELVEYTPLMLGVTVRPGEYPAYERVSGTAMTRFAQWCQDIYLEPLSPEHSAQIVADVSGRDITLEQQERIYARSEGNPLFTVEVARAAFTAPSVSIPDTLQKIVESRVDTLPEGPRQTIKAAAVIGLEFSLPELRYLLREGGQDLRRNLATLRRMHLVDIREKSYRFVHALTQEVVYLGLNVQARRASHRRLGTYWEEQADPSKAAHHYYAGELWGKALEQGERAADWHRESCAYQEAIRLYGQALEAAQKTMDLEAQGRLNHRLGQARDRIGEYDRAAQAYRRELDLLSGQGAGPLEQAAVHCALGQVYDRWGRYDEALGELGRGLELLGEQVHVTRARLLRTRCSVLISRGKLDEAERNGLEALQVARDIGDRLEEAYVCNNLGAVYGTRRQGEQALAYHRQSLELRREVGATWEVAQSLGNVGTASILLKRYAEAEDCFRQAIEVFDRIGDRRNQGFIHHNLAWTYVYRDQLDRAEPEFRRALSLWEPIDHRRGIAFAHNDLGTLCMQQGRLQEARDHLEESARRYEEMGANAYLPDNYVALARVYLQLDRPQDAVSVAQKALGAVQDRTRRVTAHLVLGETHKAALDLAEARRQIQEGLALARADPPLADQVQAATQLLDEVDEAGSRA
jgi:class 3 adenylate cyclase/tetratricopeptide (TPR) repeat protein